jgi:ubiquinone/menaquinone biosynthesis C-methylase UbiE
MGKMNRFERWMVNRRTDSRARRVLAKLGSNLHLEPSAQVLELGSGGGGLIALLFERYHPAHLIGTDFDQAQLAAASEFLTTRWGTLPPAVELKQADALALPFPDASFDHVFAMMMLHHVEGHFKEYARRPQALTEIRRVLRPGGSLVYSDIFRREEIRRSLSELEFTQQYLHSGWRSDLGIYRRSN